MPHLKLESFLTGLVEVIPRLQIRAFIGNGGAVAEVIGYYGSTFQCAWGNE